MFFESVFLDKEILEKNMLYRPCLIKLNGKYHLREQELPFFITLAHEFLHALNQMERIQYIATQMAPEYFEKISTSNDIQNAIDNILPMQTLLRQKLNTSPSNLCFKEKYKELWQNNGNDDSLDEMTVILGSNGQISDKESVFIGETTILQEFYNNPTIISWTHCNAHDYEFYTNKMNTSLEPEYVECVLRKFYASMPTLEDTTSSDDAKIILFGWKDLQYKDHIIARKDTEAEVKKDLKQPKIVRLKRKNSTISQFILYPPLENKKLLPIFSSRKTTLTINGYTIIDVPGDGNCAFWAVLVANGDIPSDELSKLMAAYTILQQYGYSPN